MCNIQVVGPTKVVVGPLKRSGSNSLISWVSPVLFRLYVRVLHPSKPQKTAKCETGRLPRVLHLSYAILDGCGQKRRSKAKLSKKTMGYRTHRLVTSLLREDKR